MFGESNNASQESSRFSKNLSDLDMQIKPAEKISSVFDDHLVSAFSKAMALSQQIKNVTLGPSSNSFNSTNETYSDCEIKEENNKTNDVIQLNTPKRNQILNLSKKDYLKKNKVNFISTIINENDDTDDVNGDGDSFSKKKLLLELECQRKLTVDMVMHERIRNMHDTEKLINNSLKHMRKAQLDDSRKRIIAEQKLLDDIVEQEIKSRPQREAKLAQDNLKNAQRIHERNQKVKEAEEEAKRKSERNLRKRKYLDLIFEWQREYRKEYKDMLETMKSCRNKAALAEITTAQTSHLKSCVAKYEIIIRKCETSQINSQDLESTSRLLETLKATHKTIASEVKRINEAVDAETKIAEELQIKAKEEKPSNQSTSESFNLEDLSDCFDSQSLQTHLKLRKFLEEFQKSYAPFMDDGALKKFRFNCQKAVTIPLNAISPVNASHLSDKFYKLHNLLSGQTVMVGDVSVCASQHPMGVAYCKNLLAKKFVRQGDLTVSSKPDAAFAIAAVLVSLWVDFPDFGQLVLSHFQMACPYLAPVFMPQIEGQSTEEYHISLGYHYRDGEVEKQDSFLKRMSGIMRLYAAVLISKVRQGNKSNPLGVAEGWRWMSAILNLTPRPDICASLLYDFLEVAGNAMFRTYGGQFKKMLFYICQEYFPKLEKVTPASAGGPLVRLEQFLQKVLKTESIPPPHGMLPNNFW